MLGLWGVGRERYKRARRSLFSGVLLFGLGEHGQNLAINQFRFLKLEPVPNAVAGPIHKAVPIDDEGAFLPYLDQEYAN